MQYSPKYIVLGKSINQNQLHSLIQGQNYSLLEQAVDENINNWNKYHRLTRLTMHAILFFMHYDEASPASETPFFNIQWVLGDIELYIQYIPW